jgi:hypothetical protein
MNCELVCRYAGCIPAKVLVMLRAMVTAGLAKLVEAVNQWADVKPEGHRDERFKCPAMKSAIPRQGDGGPKLSGARFSRPTNMASTNAKSVVGQWWTSWLIRRPF